MKYIPGFFFLLFFIVYNNILRAQPVSIGSLTGKAKDSVYNFMLTGATVAVYKDADTSLLQYTLPDNFGAFTVNKLPLDIPLRLIITHVGYKDLLKKFTLSQSRKDMDIGLLYLYQYDSDSSGNILDEVIVKSIPPMRMNGDTVEFNADAFKMDVNATAEDLMRRLPGFTIWGDGEVTYNGKKIHSILVDGKPFMGSGDPTIATQNLPKDVLDKVQVYGQRNEVNPLDSTLFANLKLKEDKKIGYFGKIGAGIGVSPPFTEAEKGALRYAADGMLSGFNKKLQLSAVGAFNNINKIANSTDVLIRNSSFKGEGANTEYQSDFTMRGLNKPAAAGMNFQYDFIPDVSYQKSSRITGNYFINYNKKFTETATESNNFLKADTVLKRIGNNTQEQINTGQRMSARWSKTASKYNISVSANMGEMEGKTNSLNNAIQHKTGLGNISSSTAHTQSEQKQTDASLGFEYTNRRSDYSSHQKKQISKDFTLGYKLDYSHADKTAQNKTVFEDRVNPAANRDFDRLYAQNDYKNITHTIEVSYPDLKSLLLGKHHLRGIEIGFATRAIIYTTDNINQVLDKNTILNSYTLNNGLSYNTATNITNIMPVINISKTFTKGLTNRYSKYVRIAADIKEQLYEMRTASSQTFQNFSYNYKKFIPQANIEYFNHQYGSYETSYKLRYSSSVSYPTLQHIAPVVDSSNIWMIPIGNKNIKPQYKKELSLGYNYTTRTAKNPFILDVSFNAGRVTAMITDSTVYNNAGVRTVYFINISNNRFAYGNISVKKAIEAVNKNTFEIAGKYSLYAVRNPQYINAALNVSNSLSHNPIVTLSFRHKDLLTLKMEENLYFYTSRQDGLSRSTFSSLNQFTRFIGTLQLPKNVVWSTNITYNKSSNNNADAVYFTIWNASLTYRFLKGNRGEAKFSALDLLRQNKGIVNTSEGNTQIFTVSNVLQNYFMFTLSYFPRKFGR